MGSDSILCHGIAFCSPKYGNSSVFLRPGLSHASDSENVSRFVVGGNLLIEAVRVDCKPFPLSVFRCFHAVQSVVGKPVTSCGLFLSCLPADAADVSVVAGCSGSVSIVQLLAVLFS